MVDSPKITQAILSVSDKSGLAEFAAGLVAAGVELLSTGGTQDFLRQRGIAVRDVASYTGFPEMLDGRLKTLHPKIFGGILGRPNREDDRQSLRSAGIEWLPLVVVNLYPFEATVARNVSEPETIEQIDIGGPSLVRAAAKNHAFVTVATDARQYGEILQQIAASGCTTLELRRRLAVEAFRLTARYDRAITDYLARNADAADGPDAADFPDTFNPQWRRQCVLRYGENPHQRAALYVGNSPEGSSLVTARQLHGKDLSYNNLLDLDAALGIVRDLPEPSMAVIKHHNPCGAGSAATLAAATRKALGGDPLSAFGSVLGCNRPVEADAAEVLCAPDLFIEAVVAPSFSNEALEILTSRPKWRANVRLMEVRDLRSGREPFDYRFVNGGCLVQDADNQPDPESDWRVVTRCEPTQDQWDELRFAWALVRHVKSNAIVVTSDRTLCGAGAGQMSRVDAVEIALRKAGDRAVGGVLASDAFFPFADSIHLAGRAGLRAIIQPGGSRRDDETAAACDELGLPMIFTGRRHFRH